jgi:integrase
MAKVNFKLKEPNSKTDTLIYAILYFDYDRVKYSTSEKIHPKFWNKESQRVKETKSFPTYPEFNSRLDDIDNKILNSYRKLKNDGIAINRNNLKVEIERQVKNISTKAYLQDLTSFIEKYESDKKGILKPNTLKKYKTLSTHLKAYSTKYSKRLYFDDITMEFYNSFTSFLTVDQKLAVNTIGRMIRALKTLLNEATEYGYNTNMDFRKKKFKGASEEVDKIYLNLKELEILQNIDLSKKPSYERVRDLFLIGCYTGLRFSDFIQIKPVNIIDNKIRITTEKTNELVSIPLHPKVKAILEKYNGEIPTPISNQKMNVYLKELTKDQEEFKELFETKQTKAGVLTKTSVEKYNLISTHTARRSFATNLFLADVPPISIMKITGHKTERAFLSYIRMTSEQNADKLLDHSFFK